MKNPWISYTLLRLGMFFLIFVVLLQFEFNPFFAAIIAAVVSFAISLVFLDRQRRAMSETVANKLTRNSAGSYDDVESDLENEILDSEAEAHQDDSGSDQDSKP